MAYVTPAEVLLGAALGALPGMRRADRWYFGLSLRGKLAYAVVLACLATSLSVATRRPLPQEHET